MSNKYFILSDFSRILQAVPEGTDGYYIASGTVQTCTAQGFLLIMFTLTVAIYVASLSICSYLSIKYKFNEEKYKWIEKWMHIAALSLPFAFATTTAAMENINPNAGGCFIASYPQRCNTNPDVPCVRGGGKIKLVSLIFGLGQVLICFVIPPSAMISVCVLIRKARDELVTSTGMKHVIECARKQMMHDVMVQISLYLLSFWSTYILNVVHFVIRIVTRNIVYNLIICGNILFASQGIIFAMVYFQLQNMAKSAQCEQSVTEATNCEGRKRLTDVHKIRLRAAQNKLDRKSRITTTKVRFSIFDGTPSHDSPWAKYLEEDYDDDEEEDEEGEDFMQEDKFVEEDVSIEH